jgi:hypothetical protein
MMAKCITIKPHIMSKLTFTRPAGLNLFSKQEIIKEYSYFLKLRQSTKLSPALFMGVTLLVGAISILH